MTVPLYQQLRKILQCLFRPYRRNFFTLYETAQCVRHFNIQ